MKSNPTESMRTRVARREADEDARVRAVGDRARAEGSAHSDPNVAVRFVAPTREPISRWARRRYL